MTGATGTPTGTVALMTDSTLNIQQGQTNFALTNGSFSSSTVGYLPGGTYNIWGQYSGDGTDAPSTSPKTQIVVTPEASTLNFEVLNAASPNAKSGLGTGASVSYGTQLLLAGQVYGSTFYTTCVAPSTPPSTCIGYTSPTGVVTFSDGGSAVNAAVINTEGDAEYNAPLAVGSHSITASYAGDSSYQASSSSPFTLTITKNTPLVLPQTPYEVQTQTQAGLPSGQADILTIVVMNSTNAAIGSSGNLIASTGYPEPVPAAPPTGTLTLTGGPSGTPTSATLVAGVDPTTGAPVGIATITIPSTSSNFNLGITYSGDSNYNSVADTGNNAFVIPYLAPGGTATSTTASMTGSISPTTSVTLTGTVTGASGKAAPTGYVEIYAGGYVLNYIQLTASTASLALPFHPFTLYTTGGGALLACVLLLAVPARRRAWRNFLALVLIACIAGFDIGCGGGSSSSSGSGGSGGTGGGGGGTGAAPFATFTATLNSASLLQGSNTITVQYLGDTTYGPSSYTIANPLSNPLSDFALTSSSAIVPTPLGSSSTPTPVYVTPTNGFSGSVNLTCAVAGAPTGVSCALSAGSVSATNPAQPLTLTVTTTASANPGNYTVTVTGVSGGLAHTLGVTAVVP